MKKHEIRAKVAARTPCGRAATLGLQLGACNPGFAMPHTHAGEEFGRPDVPPGTCKWSVPWEDVLCLELKWTTQDPQADRLIVHRKGHPGARLAAGGGRRRRRGSVHVCACVCMCTGLGAGVGVGMHVFRGWLC